MESKRKLPLKAKSGSLNEKCLTLNIGERSIEIPWEKIRYICMGIIEEQPLDVQGPQPPLRKMFRKVLFGEDNKKDIDYKHSRINYMLDLYTELSDEVYRIDGSSISYKEFFDKLDYISLNNFNRLVKEIASFSKCVFNPTLKNYLEDKKFLICRHSSIYDFELDNYNFIKDRKSKEAKDICTGKEENAPKEEESGSQ